MGRAPPREGAYSHLGGVVCCLLLMGCTGKSTDTAPAESAADDSGVTDSADSQPVDTGPCAAVAPLDLADGRQVLEMVVAMPLLREVQERRRFGLVLASSACPTSENLPEEDGFAVRRVTGGCVTEEGVSFEGTLTERTAPDARSWEGEGWSVSAPDGAAYALDGSWSVEDLDEGEARAREERMSGTLLALSAEPDDIRDAALPMGFTGRYTVARSTDEAGVELHLIVGELELPCRGQVSASYDTLHSLEGCPDGLPDGVLGSVTQGESEARLVGEMPRSCERCWTHSLDGVEQGEVCF